MQTEGPGEAGTGATGDSGQPGGQGGTANPASGGQQGAGQGSGTGGGAGGADGGPGTGDARFTQSDIDRIVADRVARERAKYADYGEVKKRAAAAMTEQERAVADAATRGRTEALAGVGQRLAAAEFRAAAAGRLDNIDELLEDLNLGKFVAADGEPDLKAIRARVDKWAPKQQPTDYDGGARSTRPAATNMNQLIRQRAGLG